MKLQRYHMFLDYRVPVLWYILGTWGTSRKLLMPIQIRLNERQPDEFQIAIFIYLV